MAQDEAKAAEAEAGERERAENAEREFRRALLLQRARGAAGGEAGEPAPLEGDAVQVCGVWGGVWAGQMSWGRGRRRGRRKTVVSEGRCGLALVEAGGKGRQLMVGEGRQLVEWGGVEWSLLQEVGPAA